MPHNSSASPAAIPDDLLALAPQHLSQHRDLRYLGQDLCIDLSTVAPRDQVLLRKLYDALAELLSLITDESSDDPRRWRDLNGWTRRHDLDILIDEVREIGHASHAAGPSEALSKTMHDVRGGGLSALLGRLQMLGTLTHTPENLQAIFVLARDHNKIMRSALLGLDDARRADDLLPKSHSVELVLQKWHEAIVGPKADQRSVRMIIDCRHAGAFSECCLESAALDRIFYNLANNACRHCVGERMYMVIFPVPEAPGECLRFVLSNPVSDDGAATLRNLAKSGDGDDAPKNVALNLKTLFSPKISSTGSGFGLTVVADFVASAFGLRDRAQALDEGYVGAVLEQNEFRVWFHWPIANPDLSPKLDDYRRPALSLR